jgi:hypothetical protein
MWHIVRKMISMKYLITKLTALSESAVYFIAGCFKKCPWGPGSKQETASVNLVPRNITGTYFKHPQK